MVTVTVNIKGIVVFELDHEPTEEEKDALCLKIADAINATMDSTLTFVVRVAS